MHPELIAFILAVAGLSAMLGCFIWACMAAFQWLLGTANELFDLWRDLDQ